MSPDSRTRPRDDAQIARRRLAERAARKGGCEGRSGAGIGNFGHRISLSD